jgi:NADP-dependent 3-hydroxy acid dehydrogenase YdfG
MSSSIFVTGAASGIGRATAELFATRGWRVAVADRDQAGAMAVAISLGAAATPFCVDVLDEQGLARSIEAFCGTEGKLTVMFNCAGLVDMRPLVESSLERQFQVLDVNVKGVLNGIHAALPYLRRNGAGRIVTMSSAAAVYGVPDEAVYSASKFAVRALTEALDIEFEPLGVRVSDVMVAYVNTPMVTAATVQAKSIELLGVNVEAGQVAETVWQAVHGSKVHWFATAADEDYFHGINAASQDERRALVKSITGY